MHRLRRSTLFLALLAVVLYGITPAFAALQAARSAAGCAPGAVHRCACRVDPHAGKECCCSHDGGGSGPTSGLERFRCGGAGPEGLLRTAANPLSLPTLALVRPAGLRADRVSSPVAPALRSGAPRLTTPPPRTTSDS
jgi:hypothetical protein